LPKQTTWQGLMQQMEEAPWAVGAASLQAVGDRKGWHIGCKGMLQYSEKKQ
jgi:hypothetical protein